MIMYSRMSAIDGWFCILKYIAINCTEGGPVGGPMKREIFNREIIWSFFFWWKTKTLINVIMGLNYILKIFFIIY